MSQMDWKYLRELAAGTLQDVSIAVGDTLRNALYKLQGQTDALKTRASALERNVQGSVLLDLTGASSPYYMTEEDSQKPVIIFFEAPVGITIYLHDSTQNPVIYKVFNCSNDPINFVLGGETIQLPPIQWSEIGYGFAGGSVLIEHPGTVEMGNYGDITVSSNGSVWAINNAVIDYAKLTTGLKNLIDGKIDATQKGAANGVAPLNSSQKIDSIYLPDSVLGNLKFKGTWDASTNVITSADPALNGQPIPAAASGNEGYYFIISVAGATNVSGITDWKVGDWCLSYGTSWAKIDNTDSVSSVNGQTGTVVLGSDNISEGAANLYFTTARAIAAITNATHGTMVNAAGSKSTPALADLFGLMDSASSFIQKKISYQELRSALAGYFATLYLALPGANGIAVRTSATTAAARSIVGTANQVDVANGDGVAANPTLSLPVAIIAPGSIKVTTTLDVGATGSSFPGWIAQFTANANTYSQISHQNKSAGASASGDLIVTADDGTDTTHYIDLGINSSGYANAGWTVSGARDGYLYTATTHLSIGTAAAKDLIFHTGGTLAENIRLRIMSNGEWRLNNGGSGNPNEVLTCKGSGLPPVWQVPTLDTYNYNTTTDYRVTSTSYAVVNAAVRLTGLPAGKYFIICVAQLAADDSNVDAWLGIHAGTSGSTTLATGGEAPVRPRQSATLYPTYAYEIPVTVFGWATITAGQVIEPKVKSSSGAVDILNCSITAMRIG